MRVSPSFIVPMALLAVGLVVRAVDPVPLQTARGGIFDTYQRLHPRPYVPHRVRVIDIDDESLRRIGQWPWPRILIARMIETLRDAGAAAIALDIVFAEPDRTSPSRILPLWPHTDETRALREAIAAGRLPDHDDVLAGTIADGKVVTGFALRNEPDGKPLVKAGMAALGADPFDTVPRLGGALTSLPAIQAAAAGNGALTVTPDADGVLRRVPLLLGLGDTVYPTLAAEALRVAQGARTYVGRTASRGRLAGLVIGRYTIPTDGAGQLRLYETGSVPQRVLPAWRILDGPSRAAGFADAIVFIGSSATGIEDLHHTPLSTTTPGVVTHAQAVEQMLSRAFLFRPDWAGPLEIMVAAMVGVLLVLALRRLNAVGGFALAALSTAIIVGVCWLAFVKAGILLDPLYAAAMVIVVYLGSTATAYLLSERERRKVRSAFGQYLAPALVERLASNPALLSLGGEIREITILFCDIRGFTALSERLGAQELTCLVNRFHTTMTDAILDHGGIIDKYIGDCVMAFWNAPLDDPAHARHACEAALSMRARLRRLNDALAAESGDRVLPVGGIEMGVGINTGPCCVGNMGSTQRFNYSALGDSVNLAARLEEATKDFGVDIVIGESTRECAPEIGVRELGPIAVRGRTRTVRAFTLPDDGPERADRGQPAMKAKGEAP